MSVHIWSQLIPSGPKDKHIWARGAHLEPGQHIWSWHSAAGCGAAPGQVSEPLGAAGSCISQAADLPLPFN